MLYCRVLCRVWSQIVSIMPCLTFASPGSPSQSYFCSLIPEVFCKFVRNSGWIAAPRNFQWMLQSRYLGSMSIESERWKRCPTIWPPLLHPCCNGPPPQQFSVPIGPHNELPPFCLDALCGRLFPPLHVRLLFISVGSGGLKQCCLEFQTLHTSCMAGLIS